ncbi:MAG: hypothetical protein F6J94_21140 [Moorea sp. SIO1F2]|uniref:hypothetical protein n=1 Tax=Moorena sp. SIO1F2 TaxID=2607819 RepID=UPI0013B7C82E|nr:hypothetical protein [Moorena sp. SIO1F2]NET84327.1 hypothetical protein [Moorena sp. SIO1F2]
MPILQVRSVANLILNGSSAPKNFSNHSIIQQRCFFSDSRFPIPDSRFPTPYSLLPIPDF